MSRSFTSHSRISLSCVAVACVLGACSYGLDEYELVDESSVAGGMGGGGDSSTGGKHTGGGGGDTNVGGGANEDCGDGTYDDDDDASTACAEWTECKAGELVEEAGTATSDQGCAPCETGTFSSEVNQSECEEHSACESSLVRLDGTEKTDAECIGTAVQFGTATEDIAYGVFVDQEGNVYVTGATAAALPGQSASGSTDCFLRKYNAQGVEQWTRQFGTSGDDGSYAVRADTAGNVYVAGYTTGAFTGQTSAGDRDIFVRKYDAAGSYEWVRQFGSTGYDYASSLGVDATGNIYVVGLAFGALPTQTAKGNGDGFVRKYDASGAALWTRQFGTTGTDIALAVSIDAAGNSYIGGSAGGALGPTWYGGYDAYLVKYSTSGSALWAQQFGTNKADGVEAMTLNEDLGLLYLAGEMDGDAPDFRQVFVAAYDLDGVEQWSETFGSTGRDDVFSVVSDSLGNIYVAGQTNGTLPGQTALGVDDAYVTALGTDHAVKWSWQFGTASSERATSLALSGDGTLYVVGNTSGTLAGQTSLVGVDAFLATFEL